MFTRQRFVVVGVIGLGVVTAIVLSQLTEWLWVQIGWDDPFLFGVRQLPLTTAIAYGIALVAAIVLLKHKQTFTLANEVVDELAKVSWPTREETIRASGTVVLTTLFVSGLLSVYDLLWKNVADYFLFAGS